MLSVPRKRGGPDARRSPRGEQGQIVPLMIALMILIILGGMVVFWIGYSTSLGASGQTAADAAALAGEQAVLDYIDTSPTAMLDPVTLNGIACAAADSYATRNGSHVTSCQVVGALSSAIGFDTEVYVGTNGKLPSGAPDGGQGASAKARASTDPFSQASPAIKTSVSFACDASVVSGPVFDAHGGQYGFFPDSGTNYSHGCEGKLAGALDKLAQAKTLRLEGASGYVAQTSANSTDPAAVAHGCGDASTTPGLASVSDSVLGKFGLVRPFRSRPDVVELAGVSCNQQSGSVDATGSGSVGLGNMNVHLVPWSGGPVGTFSFFGAGGISIGESPLKVGCQIYGVWQGLRAVLQNVGASPAAQRELLLVALITAQDESAMGQNIGPNRTDPNQSVGIYQQISADGWGTIPEELNPATAAAMFFEGGHIPGRASTQGLISVWKTQPPGTAPWALAQDTQHSGAGQNSGGAANYGAPANMQAAQAMFDQVTTGACKGA